MERLATGQCPVMITIINYSYHHQAGPVGFETLVRNLESGEVSSLHSYFNKYLVSVEQSN